MALHLHKRLGVQAFFMKYVDIVATGVDEYTIALRKTER